jgi:hypothetical protein
MGAADFETPVPWGPRNLVQSSASTCPVETRKIDNPIQELRDQVKALFRKCGKTGVPIRIRGRVRFMIDPDFMIADIALGRFVYGNLMTKRDDD